jgi:hypothetical protein
MLGSGAPGSTDASSTGEQAIKSKGSRWWSPKTCTNLTARLWQAESGRELVVLQGHGGAIHAHAPYREGCSGG